jgi:adenylate kinase
MMAAAVSIVRAVFLGAPGAGKGTQAQRLSAAGLLHISTGDMLRGHVAEGTPLGTKAKAFMDRGELVPDDVIIAMVASRIAGPEARKSWILDGFPRTLPQARALDGSLSAAGAKLSHVVYFKVPDQELVARLTGRRTCSNCGAIWHVKFNPTKRDGICDACGGKLTQRADDRLEAVQQRLAVYAAQTEPLLDYYRRQGVLVEVDGTQQPDAVASDVRRAMQL